jgi:hypothetical protein
LSAWPIDAHAGIFGTSSGHSRKNSSTSLFPAAPPNQQHLRLRTVNSLVTMSETQQPPPLPPPAPQPPEPDVPDDSRPNLFDSIKYPWNPLQDDPRDPTARIVWFHAACDYLRLHDNPRRDVFALVPTPTWTQKPTEEIDQIMWAHAVTIASRLHGIVVARRRLPHVRIYSQTDLAIARKEIEKQFPFQQLQQQLDEKATDDASAIKSCFDCVKYPWNPKDENPHDPNSSIAQFHSLCDYMDLHDDDRAFLYFKCKKHFDSIFPERARNQWGQSWAIMKLARAIANRHCPNSLLTRDDEKQATLEFHQQCTFQIPSSNSDDDDSSLDEEAHSYFNKKPAAVNTSEEITILESKVPAVKQAKLKPVPSSIPEQDLIPVRSP